MSDAARWVRALEIFQAALDLPDDERAAWIERQTGGDEDLRRDVEALLSAHGREHGPLDRPLAVPPEDEGLQEALCEALEDRYRLEGELGRGGMAVVFLAREAKHDRTVVLKVIRPGIAARYGVERFEREIRLAARLSHPNILGLLDSGRAGGLPYYVMPHLSGRTLRARLSGEERIPAREAISLLRDVAGALAHAHAADVVHRDLKPDNILLVDGHAYLIDFGVAKLVDAETDPPLTRSGDAVGTPRYMAPEQLAGLSGVDRRADVYAWGQLAHEMLVGVPRELAPGDLEGRDVAPDIAAELQTARPDVPAWLAALVGRCLEVRPSRRIGSAGELVEALDREGIPRSRLRRGRGLAGAGLAGAVALAALALVVGPPLGWRTGDGSRQAVAPSAVDGVLEGPIAVLPFVNETGDPAFDLLGRLAGDWITEGLHAVGLLPVVPWPNSLAAADQAAAASARGGPVDLASFVAAETGATTVVAGSYFRVGDALRFRAEVVDVRLGRVLGAPPAETAPVTEPQIAIEALRDRLMGSVALATDERLAPAGSARRPPTFEAYRAFDAGMEKYISQRYAEAVEEFFRAFQLDTTFTEALLLAATNLYNRGTRTGMARADSVLEVLATRRGGFTRFQELRWTFLRALLDSDAEAALDAARRTGEIAPTSRTAYNAAQSALDLMRPALARRTLERLDPDRGSLRGWPSYWTALAHARHLTGDHEGELAAARAMRSRHPERRIARVLEVRALAAAGRREELEQALEEQETLSTATYWSLGAALVVAGEELRAHGHAAEGVAMLERGVAWLEARLRETPGLREHRYWIGSALYDLGKWSEAESVFTSLAEEFPERESYTGLAALALARMGRVDEARRRLSGSFPYSLGERGAFLGRIAGIAGDPEMGVTLLIEGLRRGIPGAPWLHAAGWPDLLLLAEDPRLAAVLGDGTAIPIPVPSPGS
ncbi:MAG: serine/threonine-protein kinase [Gemmatimonadota bacterium]|nr:serine/threonine-protein kinase [Gemmatimonadota bacterium]